MLDNNFTNCSVGCYFVQFQKNCSHHRIIGHSFHRTMFGTNLKIGLSSTNLTTKINKTLKTEEDINTNLTNHKIGDTVNEYNNVQ